MEYRTERKIDKYKKLKKLKKVCHLWATIEHHLQIEISLDHRYFRFYTWISKNVSKKVLLTGPKIQVKIPSHSGVYSEEGGSV